MPNYFYTAKSLTGQTKRGNLPATDEHQLAQILKNQGLILLRADLEGKSKVRAASIFSLRAGVSETEKIIMIRNLRVMISSGLPLVKSLDILAIQSKNKKLKSALLDIKEKINQGDNFSDSLARYPDIFSELMQNMVRIGEESGTLDEVFGILSVQIEKDHELKSKLKGAMIYPGIILSAMMVIGMIVAIFVLPSLSKFFDGLNVQLPLATRFVIGFGRFSQKYWYVLLMFPVLVIFTILVVIKTKTGKFLLDTLLLKIPLISSLVKKSNSAIFTRSLSSLLSSGVSLTRSLDIISKTVGNYYFKKALFESIDKVKKGERISVALKGDRELFPFGLMEMMEVGEETGKTSAILKKLAEFYEEEVMVATANISIAIEPALIIVLGMIVAFFAISVMGPMYSVLGSI